MFALCVYGLSVAQLTGNLNPEEKAHPSLSSHFCCTHQRDKAKQGPGPGVRNAISWAMPLPPPRAQGPARAGLQDDHLVTIKFLSRLAGRPLLPACCAEESQSSALIIVPTSRGFTPKRTISQRIQEDCTGLHYCCWFFREGAQLLQ